MAYQAIPPVSSGGIPPWVFSQMDFIAARDATITKTQFWTPNNQLWAVDRSPATNTGTADLVRIAGTNSYKMRLASGATANSLRMVRNRTTAVTGAASIYDNLCANVRTSHWAMATRVIVNAVNATCSLYAANMSDEVTADCYVGVIGATSQTTFTLKIGGAAAVDSGVSVGTLGTTETDIVMLCDGTNVSCYFNGNTTAAATGLSNTAANAAGHAQWLGGNGATASNASIDVIYFVSMTA